MSKPEKKSLVPKRRFSEFQGQAEWELRELGDCLDYLQPTNYLVSSTAYDDKYDIPVLTAGKTFILGYTNETEGVFYEKLPVIIFDDFTTASKYVDFPFKAKSSAMKILLAKEDANIKFAYESMQMIKYEVGVHERHWISTFSKIEIPAPHPKEQQKIADCLASVDELITAQTQKLDALKTHKKGLMQQLFPAEGETVPKLRFPEFRDKEEWGERRLGDACEKIMDGTHFSPKSKSGPRLYLTSKNIQNGEIDLSNISYISEEEHREIYKKCPVKKNDVLLTKDGANTGNCALNNIDYEFSLLSSVAVLRGIPSLLDQRFLYQLVLADRTQKIIQESMSGQAITRITLEKIGNFVILITGIEEQQKIADCLTSVDELITAQTQKLDALKTHKNGLMQQLFPAMDEVAA